MWQNSNFRASTNIAFSSKTFTEVAQYSGIMLVSQFVDNCCRHHIQNVHIITRYMRYICICTVWVCILLTFYIISMIFFFKTGIISNNLSVIVREEIKRNEGTVVWLAQSLLGHWAGAERPEELWFPLSCKLIKTWIWAEFEKGPQFCLKHWWRYNT